MSDKIHPPTPRQRKKAKEQGRAPKSGDVVSAGLLLATTGLLSMFGPRLSAVLLTSINEPLTQQPVLSIDRSESYRMIAKAIATVGYLVLPMLVAMMMCGIAFNLMQTGLMLSPSKLVPSLDRLSLTKRVQSIFSVRSLGRFGITMLKLAAVIAVSITVMRSSFPQLIAVTGMPLRAIATTIFQTLTDCCLWVGMTLLAFAAVDYALAWWQHERDLMMTEQELRDEMRDAEGSKQAFKPARSQSVQGVA